MVRRKESGLKEEVGEDSDLSFHCKSNQLKIFQSSKGQQTSGISLGQIKYNSSPKQAKTTSL